MPDRYWIHVSPRWHAGSFFCYFWKFYSEQAYDTIEQIFIDINGYIFQKDHVDLEHTYIDGTKIEANANRYTWVWKKSCLRNRDKVFGKISGLIGWMNEKALGFSGVKLEKRETYAVEYVEEMLAAYERAQAWMLQNLYQELATVRTSARNNTRKCRDIWSD